jgi:hypothetical protein
MQCTPKEIHTQYERFKLFRQAAAIGTHIMIGSLTLSQLHLRRIATSESLQGSATTERD